MTSAEEQLYNTIWQQKVAREADLALDGSLRTGSALRFIGNGKKFLDIGCGEGTLCNAVRDRFAETHGIDIAEDAVARARTKGVIAVRANLNSDPIPYPDGTFDTVATLDVIEHVFDPVRFVHEVRRVLRPGGVLVLSTPNIRKLQRIVTLIRGHFPGTSYDPVGFDGGHLHYFTSRDVVELLSRQGFTIVSVAGICGDRRTWKYRLAVGLLGKNFEREFLSSAIIVKAVAVIS
jgi:methionine biosynthesis protein MetW